MLSTVVLSTHTAVVHMQCGLRVAGFFFFYFIFFAMEKLLFIENVLFQCDCLTLQGSHLVLVINCKRLYKKWFYTHVLFSSLQVTLIEVLLINK